MTTYNKEVRHVMSFAGEDMGLVISDSAIIGKELNLTGSDELIMSDLPAGWSLSPKNTDSIIIADGGSYLCHKADGSVTAGVVVLPAASKSTNPRKKTTLPSNPTVGDDTIDTVNNTLPAMAGCGFTPLQFCEFVCTRETSGSETIAASAVVGATLLKITGSNLSVNGRIFSLGTGILTYKITAAAINGANVDLTVTPPLLTAVPNATKLYLLSEVNVKGTQYGSAADNSISAAVNSSFDGTIWRYGANRPEIQTINIKLILESTAKRDEFIGFMTRTAGYVIQIKSNLYGDTPMYCTLNSGILEFTKITGDGACSVWSTDISFIRTIQ